MQLPVAIDTPCGADWNAMTPAGARKRLCGSCDKVVHDLAKRTDDEVEALLANGPVCVRYLYDVHGRRVLEAPAGARIIPAQKLLSKIAQSRWARVAAIAGSAIVFEACGGNDGGYRDRSVEELNRTVPVAAFDADAGADAGPDAAR